MPSISDIIQISWYSVMRAARRDYTVGGIADMENSSSKVVFMMNPSNGHRVPITWSYVDEAKADTEAKKILLASNLLRNGILSLDDLAEHPWGIRTHEK